MIQPVRTKNDRESQALSRPDAREAMPEENEPCGAEKNPGATNGISSGIFKGPDNVSES